MWPTMNVVNVAPMLSTVPEIQSSYHGERVAREYVARRFESELARLLHERQVAAVNRLLRDTRPERVLEIAPGPGRLTRDIAPIGKLTCLEFNEGMIAEGRVVCGDRAFWVQGDAFELPFQKEFDLAYSFRFIRHFQRDDRFRLYEQIRRVLKPGGRLICDAVNEQVSGQLRENSPQDYPIYDKLYRNEADLRQELEQAGFDVILLEPVQCWYSLQYKAQVLLGPRSAWACRLAIRTLENLRRGAALEWIVTARMRTQ